MDRVPQWRFTVFRLNTQLFYILATNVSTGGVRTFFARKPDHWWEDVSDTAAMSVLRMFACRTDKVPAIIRCNIRVALHIPGEVCRCPTCEMDDRLAALALRGRGH